MISTTKTITLVLISSALVFIGWGCPLAHDERQDDNRHYTSYRSHSWYWYHGYYGYGYGGAGYYRSGGTSTSHSGGASSRGGFGSSAGASGGAGIS